MTLKTNNVDIIFFIIFGTIFPYTGIFSDIEVKILIVNQNNRAKTKGTKMDCPYIKTIIMPAKPIIIFDSLFTFKLVFC